MTDAVKRLIDTKRKLMNEVRVMEDVDKKTRTDFDKRTMVQLRRGIEDINLQLAELGYMPKKVDQSLDGKKLMALKNIIADNFGISKSILAIECAERRVENNNLEPFKFISDEEWALLNDKNKLADLRSQLAKVTLKLNNARLKIEGRLKVESDYKIRVILTEIFKAL